MYVYYGTSWSAMHAGIVLIVARTHIQVHIRASTCVDMQEVSGHSQNTNNLKCMKATEVSYNNMWMRNRPVQTGAIRTHKHYCYGLRKKEADDLHIPTTLTRHWNKVGTDCLYHPIDKCIGPWTLLREQYVQLLRVGMMIIGAKSSVSDPQPTTSQLSVHCCSKCQLHWHQPPARIFVYIFGKQITSLSIIIREIVISLGQSGSGEMTIASLFYERIVQRGK